jgi:Flp pilus assembly protein TadD
MFWFKYFATVLFLAALFPQLSASEDFTQRAEQDVNNDAADLLRQGQRLFAEGQPDAAIAALRRCVELRPDSAVAWKSLGVVYASRQNFDQAETPFRNACERQPALPDACLYYGRTLYLLNRFRPAIDVLRRVLQREPNRAEASRLLALSFEGLGEPVEAERAFREAIRLNRGGPADEDPGIDYAVFLSRQGQTAQSLEPLAAALQRHPDSARAHLELGCILLSLDRLAEAAAQLEQALALDPSSARGHQLLGKAYLRLGKPEAAEPHLRQGSRTIK